PGGRLRRVRATAPLKLLWSCPSCACTVGLRRVRATAPLKPLPGSNFLIDLNQCLRRVRATAPLKRYAQTRASFVLVGLRRVRATAPLKLETRALDPVVVGQSPSRSRDGSIEACRDTTVASAR